MTTLSIVLLSLLVIAVFLIIWIISTYNHFIHLSNMLKEAWSGIDVQLKRRFDLIPNLLETVKGYTKHEKDVFENVLFHSEVLMFNLPKLKGHYFLENNGKK